MDKCVGWRVLSKFRPFSSLPWLLFSSLLATSTCACCHSRQWCVESLGPLSPPLHVHAVSQSAGVVRRPYLFPLWFSPFQISWLNLWLIHWFFIHSSHNCNTRLESCVISPSCFLPSVFTLLETLLGMGFCPLPQIQSVISGSKASDSHSQPHRGRTTAWR